MCSIPPMECSSLFHWRRRTLTCSRSRRLQSPSGPLGDIFEAVSDRQDFHQVGITGLGVGAISGYGRPGWKITYYEIDPAVARVAGNTEFFTYLADCKADVEAFCAGGQGGDKESGGGGEDDEDDELEHEALGRSMYASGEGPPSPHPSNERVRRGYDQAAAAARAAGAPGSSRDHGA